MKEQLEKWVKDFYSGSDNAGKVELKAFNEKYSLCYLKGATGYVGRMSGNLYSPSEWFVVENFAEVDRMWCKPKNLFHQEGRLTKEDKENIIIRFNLEVPKQQRKKSISHEDKYLIAIEQGAFWAGYFSSSVYCQKIIKEDDSKFTTFSTKLNKNVTFNKNKYYYTIVDEDKTKDVLGNISKLISDYKQLSSEIQDKKTEVLKIFKNK